MYLHLRSLAAFLRDVCAACRPAENRWTPQPTPHLDTNPVPNLDLSRTSDDPVYMALRAKFAQIDAAVADFAAEIAALADDELAELIEREGR